MPAPNFTNPGADTQNWYVAARSSEVRRGKVASYPLLHRRVALYRDSSGTARAMDARCPHLGADLGQGSVEGDDLQCAFHHWRIGPDGRCRQAPDRSVRVYQVEERWGLVFFFNGPAPLFPLPEIPDAGRYRVVRMPPRWIGCHPHLVVGNGLDARHLEALHGMKFSAAPRWSAGEPYRVTSAVEGHPRREWLRGLTGSRRQEIAAEFSTLGGNLAWATVSRPVRFHALFTGQPDERGGCRTQVVLFLPAGWDVSPLKAMSLMFLLLHNDRRILERLQFTDAFAPGDEALRAFAEAVNRMPTW
jgi:phenylpropionate dioxygenase-like ring-hydroxylating dioxygenase large terminal subunit